MDKARPFFDPKPGEQDPQMLVSPSCERNRGPILEVLERVLPETGVMLEIGAGSGQHAAELAPRFPALAWQPTEADTSLHASIAAWAEACGATNIRPPLRLDVTADDWPVKEAASLLSANMLHIAPWECCLGLMAGAGRVMQANGVLAIYGPFKRDGRHTSDSNTAFDTSLKARDAAWGVRDLEAVIEEAERNGLDHADTVAMPANNLMVIFRRD